MSARDDFTHSELAKVIDYDPRSGIFTWKVNRGRIAKAGFRAGTVKPFGYRAICIKGRSYLEHRLAWFYSTEKWPDAYIDHINGDKSDNRLENLRECSHAENMQNRPLQRNNSSGKMGVSWHAQINAWTARISKDGQCHYLGSFPSLEEASDAYIKAKAIMHSFNPVISE